MKITEAINKNEDTVWFLMDKGWIEKAKALKLGIEALRFRLELEQEDPEITLELLLGETKE